ncbi:DNA/RNA-binding domain E.t1.c1-type [Penicillium chrysogenum]|nr:DNA/RNA-binding domain E.t1.c1-type [Penicillium chrysogenum]
MRIHSDFECDLCNQQSDVYGALAHFTTDIPPGEDGKVFIAIPLGKGQFDLAVDQAIVGRVKSHHTDLSHLRLLNSDPLFAAEFGRSAIAIEMDDTTVLFQYSPSDSNDASGNWPFSGHVNQLQHDPQMRNRIGDQNCAYSGAQGEHREMIKQPKTHTVTEEQLVNEVRGIYAGLVMVEKKCIEIDRQLAQSKAELSLAQWQALVSLHRTLLYEHFDFFLASQHPSASPVLRDLADKYGMPARMWRYGVHLFLELLRRKTPDSMEHMIDFIYLSYSIITLLLESVPDFKKTWIECLGDLARYRMAVEEFDKKVRELWVGVSRYWYNQDADRSAENGRIQHHLAVLACPDILQQFFHYTKALISVRPFPNAFVSMTKLIPPLMNVPAQKGSLTTSFVTTHGALLMQAPDEEFVSRANVFLATLRNEISQVGRHGQQGVQLMSCNISAIFQYGSKYGVMETDFTLKLRNPTAEDRLAAMKWASSASSTAIHTTYSDLPSQLLFRASSLAFHTLTVMLGQVGDPNMYPSVHVSMAFVWCLTLNPAAIQRLEPLVPWSLLATYLNTLFDPDTIISKIEDESFPLLNDSTTQQLPEDFLIRGQAWSRLYYPERFFEGAPTEDNRPSIEEHSTVITRRHRCLWLGVRIATFTRWMTYDQTRQFTPTRLADEFARTAQNPPLPL